MQNLDGLDPAADHELFEPAPDDLDLGQFWHSLAPVRLAGLS
jgi:hypothetical protein